MKIIITESQYRLLENYTQEDEVAKNILFKIWQSELDSSGEIEFNPNVVDYINYEPQGRLKIYEMYRDFLGGWD